ncbi:50S ribosomal protein L14e [Candidatus Woesearchaeota archaeon]|jgi:large subunit ribosomal protein L14e|nr:50S ribosomal protein L14e [Candidatus Woesearchaeota archaeon]MBT4151178.1 50S ribosomal protein L14e [Candidatus Woesearchaeota archaeon]MBT4247610.1 50S ribosomal protein L14e [Candidatus Woesearchaeota archaeon]MBT4433944.1 50S ribosomal protein L14e [Candidatus Woesearchaeota archaeon]MBT7332630.1 50S ribosomal protein L14e [Candidatus Woesearchaeota archaeon]
MSLYEVGRLCVKLAGRDAGKRCVVVEQVDKQYVLVDGATRRRKVNINHLEPLAEMLDVKSGSHADVKAAFGKIGVEVLETKKKESKERPKKQKVKKGKVAKKEEAKPEPKAEKKESPKVEEKESTKEEAPKAEASEKKE